MPFTIIRNDITKLRVDAIVNAANTSLQRGGGVCGAIFKAAGAARLQSACNSLAPIKTGEAVITEGFKLPAKYIIHTAGPVYRGGHNGEESLLRACYLNALALAVTYECKHIAFPLISSGIYGYPKVEALRVATKAIGDFLCEHDIDVSLVVFDNEAFTLSEERFGAVKRYIDEHYVEERQVKERKRHDVTRFAQQVTDASPPMQKSDPFEDAQSIPSSITPPMMFMPLATTPPNREDIDTIISNLDEPFSATLLRLIDTTGKKDADIYRRANIDRRLFSKIRSNKHYSPSKPTVLAFAVALELTLEQTLDLLERAGFALSHSRKFDVIVEYFIKSRQYDVFEINEVLFSYDQPLLGG